MSASFLLRSADPWLDPGPAQAVIDAWAPADGWRCCEPPALVLETKRGLHHGGRVLTASPGVLLDSEDGELAGEDQVEARTALEVGAMLDGVVTLAQTHGGDWRVGLGAIWVGGVGPGGADTAVETWREALARGELQPAALAGQVVELAHRQRAGTQGALETSAWPDDLGPDGAPVATHNALVAAVAPEVVWERLVRARAWPGFYGNARDVRIEGADELGPGTVFTWRTLGLRVRTEVIDHEPGRRLTWRGDSWYGRGCHTWVITPVAGGCRVVTEEVQRGLLPGLARWWIRRQLWHWHQRWLEGLAAEEGP